MCKRMLRAGCLTVLALLVVTAACTPALAPRVTAISVSLTDVSLDDATIQVKTVMENASAVAAVLSDVNFQMFYWTGSQWSPLAQGKLGSAEVKPNGSVEITVPTTAKQRDALGAVAKFISSQGSINLKLDGAAKAKVGSSEFTVPFGQQFTLSMSVGFKPLS